MRDLIRLVWAGALVFLIVGFALIYSRDSAFRYGVSTFLGNGLGAVGRAFSAIPGVGDSERVLETTEIRLLRPKQTTWMGLAGFPDQTEMRFPVPPIGGHAEGELDLRFDVQLAQGGDGLLSIAVNGVRRSEIVLNTGHNGYDVRIPLDPGDLLADHVLVELSARGTTNSGQICPTDSANSGSAISVLPESGMVLRSMREQDHPETVLMTMPEPLNIQLGSDEQTQALAVWTIQRMRRAGVEALLVDGMQTTTSIEVVETGETRVSRGTNGNIILTGEHGVAEAIAAHRLDLFAPEALISWPVLVDQLTMETTARNFRGSRRWTIPYQIADLPGGRMPTSFELALKTSILAEDFEWVVRVSLNGNLLQTSRLPGDLADVRLDIALPTHLQGLTNSILVELIDTSPNESICRAGPDALAQLLPDSRLTADGPQPVDGWGALVRQLAEAAAVSPGNHGPVDVDQATRAAAMLGQFLPANARTLFAPDDADVTITLIDRERLAGLLDELRSGAHAEGGELLLITDTGHSVVNPLSLTLLGTEETQTLFERMHATDVAFLVQQTVNP